MTYVIDRFEDNNLAVLEREDSLLFNVPRVWLLEDERQGEVRGALRRRSRPDRFSA